MATNPATAPEIAPRADGLPLKTLSASSQDSVPAAAAIIVTAMAMPARASAARAEPALKPNQPTQSRQAPSMAKPRLLGDILSWP